MADRTVMRALGWAPGRRLGIREHRGLVIVAADERGVFAVTREGRLRLPAVVRQWCGLAAGDRVFLVAEPDCSRLVVHPPAALDAMIAQAHVAVLGGDGA
ncbi:MULTISPECIES: AbrB/MazE/SpoVT family DNA-binding domain-containing protein [unclassified Micromonospora]|uniref:AbrB/MazE/SpoVT family DNA-binding domain-containing protein n=1 Tax=unclassified Micromonospora TaxID=2617518 RepID=UPI003645EE88